MSAEIAENARLLATEKGLDKAADARLSALVADLEARMNKDQGRLGELQRHLTDQAGKLGEEMGALGKVQENLSEQESRESERMQQKLRELIERAQKQGLAQPLE